MIEYSASPPHLSWSDVGEDDMHAFCGVATNVGTEHDRVLSVTAPLVLVGRGCQLDVAATAVKALLMLHSVLHHKGLPLVAEGWRLRRDVIPAVISHGLEALVVGIAIELSSRQLPGTLVARLELGLDPAILPTVREIFLEKNLRLHRHAKHGGDGQRRDNAKTCHVDVVLCVVRK